MRLTFGSVLPELADGLARAAIKLATPVIVFAATESQLVTFSLVAFIAGYAASKIGTKWRGRG